MGDITFADNRFLISGDLNFSNVMSVYQKSLPQSLTCSEFTFDFSQLTSSDSAGLALIIEWVKLSKRLKKPVHFMNLSEGITSLVKVAGMGELFS